MKNEAKGAVAAGAGALLLLGGGGTFAVWTDTHTIGGGAINAGHMNLVTDGTNGGCGSWELDSGESVATTYTIGDPLVPGDVLSRECRFTIQAVGNHLRAGLVVSAANFSGGDTDFGGKLVADVSDIEVGGGAATTFTDDNDGQTLSATVTVTFNSDSTDVTEDMATTLDSMTLTATQVHS
jgi:alternate signal-mediated exported protein